MPTGSCLGEENKQRIVNGYDLVPVAQIKLLEGQMLKGCCGKVTNRYYHFEATPKSGGEVETFVVGYHCAERLLELIDHPKLHLFNPLAALGGGDRGGGIGIGGNGNGRPKTDVSDPRKLMCPLNAELYDAIHLLCMAWRTVPGAPLRRTLQFLKDRPGQPTNDSSVERFNRIVGADRKERTLTAMIDELRLQNPSLRHFAFPEMAAALTRSNVSSNL
ncbi:hypothetical protein [Paraburkholderia sp. UCT2]|uniref:hypothetical protein n=1 Tax=Paraburkholderia sp. UCT2 TaxID=2615208 RepID=UPI00165559F9|nr:hypothetical protein [Paraburkholderia sp. UCT2]MBC8729451.1 hypothetical protein [Paraburkholderia sp. UCT2]